MIHSRLVSALKKIGANVEEVPRFHANSQNKNFKATLNNKQIEWHTQANFNTKLNDYDDQLWVGSVFQRSPYTDIMTDCFCDSHRDTIKGAVGLLKGEGA